MINFTNEHGEFNLEIGTVYNFDVVGVGEVYPIYNIKVIADGGLYLELEDNEKKRFQLNKSKIAYDYEV